MGGPRAPSWAHRVVRAARGHGPDAAATLPSSPPPSLGGSDPPIAPALWGSQTRIAVVSRESLRLGTPDPISPEMPPHQIARDPRDPRHHLTPQETPEKTSSPPDLQNDSRDPHLSVLHTDPLRLPTTTRTPRDLRNLCLILGTQVEPQNKHSVTILSPQLPDLKP